MLCPSSTKPDSQLYRILSPMLYREPWMTPFGMRPGVPHVWLGRTEKERKLCLIVWNLKLPQNTTPKTTTFIKSADQRRAKQPAGAQQQKTYHIYDHGSISEKPNSLVCDTLKQISFHLRPTSHIYLCAESTFRRGVLEASQNVSFESFWLAWKKKWFSIQKRNCLLLFFANESSGDLFRDPLLSLSKMDDMTPSVMLVDQIWANLKTQQKNLSSFRLFKCCIFL